MKKTKQNFLPTPDKIIFSKYEPFKTFEKIFYLKNISKKTTRVKIILPDSEYFKLVGPKVAGKKTNLVSPGLQAKCIIKFLPVEKIDYSSELIVKCENNDKYRIPIHAYIGQADIRFPSKINFEKCPVKHMSEKVLYIQNNGEKSTRFTMNVSPPFYVEPSEVFLNKGEGKQIIFSFEPQTVLSFSSKLQIEYEEEGIIETILVKGEGKNVMCKLSTSELVLPPTFITRKTIKEISIDNRSNHKLKYRFVKFSTQREEENFLKMKEINEEEVDPKELLFSDKVFSIFPLEGEIWPNSKAFITIVFKPNTEDFYSATVWCNVTGREMRLPFLIKGNGKGPDIVFSYTKLDVAEMYIHTTQHYEIFLENRGEIDADFKLIPPTSLFGSKFSYEPSSGTLSGGQLQEIKVEFHPTVIGKFFEEFFWEISGRKKPVVNIFSGKVIGPSFTFNKKLIDFGSVSYGFVNTESIELKNTSKIPMKFNLRIPQDGTLLNKEFSLVPTKGTILPQASKKIRFEFLSHHVKEYYYKLVVDILEVGENLLSIPVIANCVVPNISISSTRINFGNCFIGFPYVRTIELGNKTEQKAKYEVTIPPKLENLELEVHKGVIFSSSTHTVKFRMKVLEIGQAVFPVYIRIIGSNDPPFEISVSYKSIGPIVEPSSKKLDFGKLQVLKPVVKKIRLINKSPIDAKYVATNKNVNVFKCINNKGIIKPNSHCDLQVQANLDESVLFKDKLKVKIEGCSEDSEEISILIKAKGKGCSLRPSINLNFIDFENQFTKKKEFFSFTIENKGRSQRQIVWKSLRKKPKFGEPLPIIYNIVPDRAVINSKEFQDFTVEAYSDKAGDFEEEFVCTIPIKRLDVYRTKIKCNFSSPLVKFFDSIGLKFEYIHSSDNPVSIQSKLFTIKNVSSLNLNMILKTSPNGPFSIEKASNTSSNYFVKVNESVTVKIFFNPNYKNDKQSSLIKSKLSVYYKDHPQCDTVDLVGSINFPNLHIETNDINFGVIRVNSEAHKLNKITNKSKSVVDYAWSFLLPNTSEKCERLQRVYDIIPFKGRILPGESENIEFIYSGIHCDEQIICKALCSVENGPKYYINLRGDCSKVKYKLDTKNINFDIVNYNQMCEREIILQNTGRVKFDFRFDKSEILNTNSISISPREGKVKSGKLSKILIRFSPGITGLIEEVVKLNIYNFDPEVIKITAVSLCPSVFVSLKKKEESDNFVKLATENLKNRKDLDFLLKEVFPESYKFVQSDKYKLIREVERLKLKNFVFNNPIQLPSGSKAKSSRQSTRMISGFQFESEKMSFSQTIPLNFTLSTYLLDFGYIIKGLSKKKKFQLTNIGYSPISISVDKKEMMEIGFTLEPSSVLELKRFEKQDFELTFSTKKSNVIGEFSYVLPMIITNGPKVKISIKSIINKPNIEVSKTKLNFGCIFVNRCKVITVKLRNKEEIKCEWYIEPLKKTENFLCNCTRGILHPNEMKNVEFTFIPSSSKKVSTTFQVRCKYSTNPVTISCEGVGEDVKLLLSANKLNFGPVLPHVEEKKEIVFTNKSKIDVELYSLNFDKKYIEDIEILRENRDKFKDGFLMIDPRKPGEDLPDFLLEKKRKREEKIKKIKIDDKMETQKKKDQSRRDFSKKEKDSAKLSKKEKVENEEVEEEKKIFELDRDIFIIHGPPLVGKTKIAEKLNKDLVLPIINIPDLLKDVEVTQLTVVEKVVEKVKKDKTSRRKNSSRTGRGKDKKEEVITVNPRFEQLKSIFFQKFGQSDCENGVIIDGISCEKVFDQELIVRALKEISKKVHLIVLSVQENLIFIKNMEHYEEISRKEVEESSFENITEDEYDNMNDVEKKSYQQKLKVLREKKCKLNKILKKKKQYMKDGDQVDIVQYLIDEEKRRVEIMKKKLEQNKKKKKRKKKKDTLEIDDNQQILKFEEVLPTDDRITREIKLFKKYYNSLDKLFENQKEFFFKFVVNGSNEKEKIIGKIISIPRLKQISEEVTVSETNNGKKEGKRFKIPDPFVKQIIMYPTTKSIKSEYIFNEEKFFDIVNEKSDQQYRMIVQANSSVSLFVKFNNYFTREKDFSSSLKFAVGGSSKEYSVECRGKCYYPDIHRSPLNIFPKRIKRIPKKRIFVKKKYVESEKYFSFGPLLVLNNYSLCLQNREDYKKYYESFTISNNGELNGLIEFSLLNTNNDNFMIETKKLELSPSETKKINVWCTPKGIGELKNSVVCCVQNNPTPFVFDIRCIGGRPSLRIDKTKIDFGKLLLSDESTRKVVKIRNTSTLPILWKIEETKALSKEITIIPREGSLAYKGSTEIYIDLETIKPNEIQNVFFFRISDTKRIVTVKSEDVVIIAETYDLKVNLERKVVFGCVKVSDGGKKQISISNNGKYPVYFEFNIPPRLNRFFKIKPLKGMLDGTNGDGVGVIPKTGKKKKQKKKKKDQGEKNRHEVEISFRTNKEITFKKNCDISCDFFASDEKDSEKLGESNLRISLKALYNEYEIFPVHGINFGPLFNGKDRTKKLTIFNKGEFEIAYKFFNFENPPKKEKKEKVIPLSKRTKQKKKKVDKDVLQIDKFFITPTRGTITPKNSVEINVQFVAEGSQTYRKVMGIDISDRNPNDFPSGIKFDLQGESCTPGIETKDYNSIFEEQKIVQRLSDLSPSDNAFCVEEKIFSFGIVRSKTKVIEKLKITNIMKIPCNVEFKIEKIDYEEEIFDIQPKKIFLPSHEHQYISIIFTPLELKNYSAIFRATVIGGEKDHDHNELQIELRGSGSLPQVDVIQPALKDENNNKVLKFPRVLLNHSHELPLIIKNKGNLPVTIRFDMKYYASLIFPERSKDILLDKNETKTFYLKYLPTRIETIETDIRMIVLDNRFEDEVFQIIAEGFEEDITFENLPKNKDFIHVPNLNVSKKEEVTFKLKSNCEYPLKFEWDSKQVPIVEISPKIGHLHPNTVKTIRMKFFTEKSISINQKIFVNCTRIDFLDKNKIVDWDDTHVRVKWVKEVEQVEDKNNKKAQRKKKKKPLKKGEQPPHTTVDETISVKTVVKKIEEVDPEPENSPIGVLKQIPLNVIVFADYAKYSISIPEDEKIKFATTFMFSSRSFPFVVRNVGNIGFKYQCLFQLPETEEYYSVEPYAGEIEKNSEQNFIMKYSPKDIGKHKNWLIFKMSNLEKKEFPKFYVTGNAKCPVVHFEVSPSDYLSNNRRDPELNSNKGELKTINSSTRVIEMKSCGVKIKTTKRFYILNPTNTSYEFKWKRVGGRQKDTQNFQCLTKKGIIKSGKKAEIVFEFTPNSIRTIESLWSFHIKERRIEIPFLVVGHASEPQVFMNNSHVNFQTVLVGAKAKSIIKLVNREKIPFSFSFNKLKYKDILKIHPKTGTIGGESEIDIVLVFCPAKEIGYNFNLVCKIKRKPGRLNCNIKGEGFIVHEKMELERNDKSYVRLSSHNVNNVNFGRVQLNDKQIRRIVLNNEGNYNFDYKWRFVSDPMSCIQINPQFGTLTKQSKIYFNIIFNPKKPLSISGCKAICKITNGNGYTLSISGSSSQPKFSFSFTKYDFGPCFLFHSGKDYVEKSMMLKVSNNELDKSISYDVIFETKPYLEIITANTILQPGERKNIPIFFKPREFKKYKEVITFVVNGLTKFNITIMGEGTPCRVDLVDKTITSINLGAVRVGNRMKKVVMLQNKSKLPARVQIPKKITSLLNQNFISISPHDKFLIAPKQKFKLEIFFNPVARLQSFTSNVELRVEGKLKQLFSLLGACYGVEVKLNVKTLSFGIVVQNTVVKKKILIENHGDVGVNFKWNTSRFRPDFSISPSSGFITPNESIPLEITFKPTRIRTVKYENLECRIEGINKGCFLNLSGTCVAKPSEESLIKFSIPVRQKQMKTVTLKNPTDEKWRLKPSFESNKWTGKEFVEIEENSSVNYEITYAPLFQTTKKKIDKGSIFFPLPNGKAYLFQLEGESTEPPPIDELKKEIFAKELFTDYLDVENWLETSQRFKVNLNFPDIKSPNAITGSADFIDVPGLVKKKFKFTFYSYVEGNFSGKISFINETTKEFFFYKVLFTVNKPQVLKTISMSSAIRNKSIKKITVQNPMEKSVEMTIVCECPEITLDSQKLKIRGKSSGIVSLTFFPIVPTKKRVQLSLSNQFLGLYLYNINLSSTSVVPEKLVNFKTNLGRSQKQILSFINYSKSSGEYSFKFEKGVENFQIVCEKGNTIKAGSDEKVVFEIIFEPSKIGDFTDKLTLTNKDNATYIFLLQGIGLSPTPQGPISIINNTTETIVFKNVLNQKIDYKLFVNNNKFSVKPQNIQLISKQKINISVSYKNNDVKKSENEHAKLSIKAKNYNNVWIYYLEGKLTGTVKKGKLKKKKK